MSNVSFEDIRVGSLNAPAKYICCGEKFKQRNIEIGMLGCLYISWYTRVVDSRLGIWGYVVVWIISAFTT